MRLHPEIQKFMSDMWRDIQRHDNERIAREAQADPVKHRLTRVMRNGLHYSYFERRNGRGSRIRFCYSKGVNVAGYYLIWRETITKKKLVRDQWDATTSKQSAIRTARAMAAAAGCKLAA